MVLACTDCGHVICDCGAGQGDVLWEWQRPVIPSIHMPRWACRILLDVVSVRVERVQVISEMDAVAELGALRNCNEDEPCDIAVTSIDPVGDFITLWNAIYAKRELGWDANPWVWVIEFKPVADEGE
jgi:hypothetical protein